MAFLTLQNIGKIYVSDTNLAVGIRGVNLSFERGEFVAVTGKSGSGKSTLLNVLSGMDTYEEGELFIEGEPTSHFTQSNWETYRQKYISFIFQDYNILESFTVLQNVELALMHIENPKERRARALELINKVGLEKHIRHKGSQLSGGQKQRTVIARALAKDSPIILADEPTGNLDSQTSHEIIELLREVSGDKLVIVVTHNFDEVAAYATRHIRIYDGAVESDETLSAPVPVSAIDKKTSEIPSKTGFAARKKTLRDGLHLGAVRFFATPKLSAFLCLLMILTSLILTVVTAADSSAIFEKQENYQFSHIDGRTVIVRKDGKTITDDELSALAATVGAKSYMHYDNILDESVSLQIGDEIAEFGFAKMQAGFSVQYGRAPEKENEVALSVPLFYRELFGGEDFKERALSSKDWFGSIYTVVGVSYYVDNTVRPTVTFTPAGYKTAAEIAFFSGQKENFTVTLQVKKDSVTQLVSLFGSWITVDFNLPDGTYAFDDDAVLRSADAKGTVVGASLNGTFTHRITYDDSGFGYWSMWDSYEEVTEQLTYELPMSHKTAVDEKTAKNYSLNDTPIFFSPSLLHTFLVQEYYGKVYTQASLFFENDEEAHDKVDTLRNAGYIAVVSDETVKLDILERVMRVLFVGVQFVGWVLTVVLVSLFLSLCSSRAMGATRGDIAIMRSMGIPTKVIRLSVFAVTAASLLPGFFVTGVACVLVYHIPKTNGVFPYMHFSQYAVIALLLLCISAFLARRYNKKMFENSVKKTLKEGAAHV